MITLTLPLQTIYISSSETGEMLDAAGFSGKVIAASEETEEEKETESVKLTEQKTVSSKQEPNTSEQDSGDHGSSPDKQRRKHNSEETASKTSSEENADMTFKTASEENSGTTLKTESDIYRMLISENADISIISAESTEDIEEILEFARVCEKLDIPVLPVLSKCEEDAEAENEWGVVFDLITYLFRT